MAVAFRWLLRLFVGLVALIFIAGFGAYYFLSRSIPDYGASYQI